MSIYSVIYIILAIVLIAYTVRHRLDILSVAAICFIIYTIYCIPGIGISGQYRPELSPKLYHMVYMQMLVILAFTMFERSKDRNDLINQIHYSNFNQPKEMKLTKENRALDSYKGRNETKDNKLLDTSFLIYTGIIVLLAALNIVPFGFSGLLSGKAYVWEQTNIFYIISLYGSFPSFAYGVYRKKKRIWIPSLCVALTIFVAGSRAFLATMMVILLCWLGVNLWRRRKSSLVIYVIGFIGMIAFLAYRVIESSLVGGNFSEVMYLLQDPSSWAKALEFNEPRVIIANYDYVLTQNFRLPAGDIAYRIIDIIPGLTDLIPVRLQYPEYFSTWLMLEVNGSQGVGGTIWGESYAMFGVIGILINTILWLRVVAICNQHLYKPKKYSAFLVAFGCYLAWYIHRLDFNRVFQFFKLTLLCFLVWGSIYLVLGGSSTIPQKFELFSVRGILRKRESPQ